MQLRAVFLEEMERVRPEWVRERQAGEQKLDFELAVEFCNEAFARDEIEKWISHVGK
jgi:hypothetical protein